jgi:hypothetical protein
MPKQPSALYNHNARAAIARQLNISTDRSGRTSVSYTSSHLPVVSPAVPHPEDEYYTAADVNMDVNMDIDNETVDDPTSIADRETVEVLPGVQVCIAKAKQYANSVGSLRLIFLL